MNILYLKVRVRVQAGERVFSNAKNGATGTASSAGVYITLNYNFTPNSVRNN